LQSLVFALELDDLTPRIRQITSKPAKREPQAARAVKLADVERSLHPIGACGLETGFLYSRMP
jgi:hypothetical protein